VLLRLILSPKVIPPSVDALNIISSLLLLFAAVVLLVHHATYTFAPVIAGGAFLGCVSGSVHAAALAA